MSCLHSQRAVHINLKAVVACNQLFLFNMAYQIQKLLGTAYCKGRNYHIARPVKGLLNNFRQAVCVIHAFLMTAVSIGGFHYYIIGLRNIFRIPDQRLILIANIS